MTWSCHFEELLNQESSTPQFKQLRFNIPTHKRLSKRSAKSTDQSTDAWLQETEDIEHCCCCSCCSCCSCCCCCCCWALILFACFAQEIIWPLCSSFVQLLLFFLYLKRKEFNYIYSIYLFNSNSKYHSNWWDWAITPLYPSFNSNEPFLIQSKCIPFQLIFLKFIDH